MIERFEGVESAVERELREELGITGIEIQFLAQEENTINSLTTFHYLAEIHSSIPVILQSLEVAETQWIDSENIQKWTQRVPEDFVPYFLNNF
jgi:NADH pyrophosphatase NudC (nudix superfamily)